MSLPSVFAIPAYHDIQTPSCYLTLSVLDIRSLHKKEVYYLLLTGDQTVPLMTLITPSWTAILFQ